MTVAVAVYDVLPLEPEGHLLTPAQDQAEVQRGRLVRALGDHGLPLETSDGAPLFVFVADEDA